MEKYKYVILGGGPAGLSLACRLLAYGENSIFLAEKESVAGGLCRSVEVDGSPFDIGGGHFLDVRSKEATSFLFEFMPQKEWNIFERDSRINIGGKLISHPLEANIWQFSRDIQEEYLESIKRAGCNTSKPRPDKFIDWISWKLGDKIAADYMLPYNLKMFADDLDELGTYWLEKLPAVSYEDVLRSIKENRAYAKQPGHAQFYYPKEFGYGEVWERMASKLSGIIRYSLKAVCLNISDNTVEFDDGSSIKGEYIINTVPWNSFELIEGLTDISIKGIKQLKSSSIETRYVGNTIDTKAQWIYEPSLSIPYHRILVRSNFCARSKGYWLETRAERVSMFGDDNDIYSYLNEYAYPLNTIAKPGIMERLENECISHKVIGLGRWGEHCHYNSDVVVQKSLKLAEKIK